MLTCEQIKAIEGALGAEAARPVVEAIQSTDVRVQAALLAEIATKADLEKLRGELRQEISELRGELRQGLSDLRGEFEQLRGETREDITGLRGELREEVAGLRGDLREEVVGLRGELRTESASLRGDLKRLDLQIKLLIGLAILAIAMFSPNLAALVKFAK